MNSKFTGLSDFSGTNFIIDAAHSDSEPEETLTPKDTFLRGKKMLTVNG